MGMQTTCGFELRQEQGYRLDLRQEYGSFGSIFPEVDAALEDTDAQAALEFVVSAARKKMDRYNSTVDFLLCEILTHFRPGCFAYYRGRGPQLREILPEGRRPRVAAVLLAALDQAKAAHREMRRQKWAEFSSRVLGRGEL